MTLCTNITNKDMIKILIFDWGDTVMRDFIQYPGHMAYWPKVEAINGIKNALKFLKNKYILCIATNAKESDTKLMIKALERVNLKKYFDYFYSSNDLGYKKSNSNFFLTIAKNIDAKTSECVMIGNDYKKDIIGAKLTGMKTILFNEKTIQDDFCSADDIIFSMDDLPEKIKNLDK